MNLGSGLLGKLFLNPFWLSACNKKTHLHVVVATGGLLPCLCIGKHRLQQLQEYECTSMICETAFNLNGAVNISWQATVCNCASEMSIS